MNVILLCAGYATRLYPLTQNQPKSLLPVGGRPMIEWILDRVLEVSGVKRACIVTNHKFAGHFEKWAKTKKYPWPVEVVDDQTTTNENRLGAIGDLQYTLKAKKIGAEDLLVPAGDNLFDFDLKKFVEFGKKVRPNGVIAVFDVKDRNLARQYGLVQLDREGRVTGFFEKPENPPTTLASCGIYWLPAETSVLLDRYLRDGHNADQPGHYMSWLAQQKSLFATPLDGRWFDIGDRSSYDKANELFGKNHSVKGKTNHEK